jgi:hypothetical protein
VDLCEAVEKLGNRVICPFWMDASLSEEWRRARDFPFDVTWLPLVGVALIKGSSCESAEETLLERDD